MDKKTNTQKHEQNLSEQTNTQKKSITKKTRKRHKQNNMKWTLIIKHTKQKAWKKTWKHINEKIIERIKQNTKTKAWKKTLITKNKHTNKSTK
jgi:hypothetical protein